ncbi:MAG: hypothetical protein JST54_34515 [Deltaproteobacteria bacterium]|nr:hypothetical protein [Deltaproteobacteria bacterium]
MILIILTMMCGGITMLFFLGGAKAAGWAMLFITLFVLFGTVWWFRTRRVIDT